MIRYLLPNAITSASIVFGVLSIHASIAGHWQVAVWWALYCVLFDKLDGFVARALRATSSFGMQLDSLADLVAFGVAPAVLIHGFFSAHPELGWTSGWRVTALSALSVGYIVCAAIRLARFNVITGETGLGKY